MFLPNNFNHQIYLSDLEVLFMVRKFYCSNLLVLSIVRKKDTLQKNGIAIFDNEKYR